MPNIESSLDRIAISLEKIAFFLGKAAAPMQTMQVPVAPMQVPVAPMQVPVAPTAAPAQMQMQMPAPPNFMQPPAPVVQAPVAPFNTVADMYSYTQESYKQLLMVGKGERMVGVLKAMNVDNINDIKPEQYGMFYQGVEALKNGA